VRVFRLCKQAYSETVLSGEGGLVVDGRWHSRGSRIVYTASSEALAVLETRVHIGRFVPKAPYAIHEIEIPEAQIQMLAIGELTRHWKSVPPTQHTCRIGDDWLRTNSALALSVPSIHTATDRNILVNPAHAAASRIEIADIRPYQFDERLFAVSARPKPRRRR
jgi:RES domain-containing protein